MKQSPIISPSLLAADFAQLGADAQAVLDAGAHWLHFDVMDNHFVPNLTIGPMVCRSLRNYGITAPIDVHLMVEPVDQLISSFIDAGASLITIHYELQQSEAELMTRLTRIKTLGCQVGLALNPATPVEVLRPYLSSLDMVLIMSVQPGFGGQAFIPETLTKLADTRKLIDKQMQQQSTQPPIRLSIDGGVNLTNISRIAQHGADTFVAGSAIFNTDDYAQIIKQLLQHIEQN